MPTYTYKCSKCEYEKDRIMKLSEYDVPCQEPCPECSSENSISRVICATGFGDVHRMKMHKVDSDWRDVLRNIDKKVGKGSTLKNSSTLVPI